MNLVVLKNSDSRPVGSIVNIQNSSFLSDDEKDIYDLVPIEIAPDRIWLLCIGGIFGVMRYSNNALLKNGVAISGTVAQAYATLPVDFQNQLVAIDSTIATDDRLLTDVWRL